MGLFGTFLFDGTHWTRQEPGSAPTVGEPWLLIDIHDSDISTVMYAPAGPGSGIAFLGFTPRTYFNDDSASALTDVVREAEGLAAWWAGLHPEASQESRTAMAMVVRDFLAADEASVDDAPDDDAEVFVEFKTAQFLSALGLATPDGLPGLPSLPPE